MRVGMCVLFGIFVFIVVEMLASAGDEEQTAAAKQQQLQVTINNNIAHNKSCVNSSSNSSHGVKARDGAQEEPARKIEVSYKKNYHTLRKKKINNWSFVTYFYAENITKPIDIKTIDGSRWHGRPVKSDGKIIYSLK